MVRLALLQYMLQNHLLWLSVAAQLDPLSLVHFKCTTSKPQSYLGSAGFKLMSPEYIACIKPEHASLLFSSQQDLNNLYASIRMKHTRAARCKQQPNSACAWYKTITALTSTAECTCLHA